MYIVGLGLYIGVAAGCVVVLLAAVVAGVILYRRYGLVNHQLKVIRGSL